MVTTEKNTLHERPELRHTQQGGLYAKPRDILTSKSAQRQLSFIRKSRVLKDVQERKKQG